MVLEVAGSVMAVLIKQWYCCCAAFYKDDVSQNTNITDSKNNDGCIHPGRFQVYYHSAWHIHHQQ